MNIGLVLEGGGVRGIYTAGVLDVFMEHGIVFDGVIGVSAGAIHGCSYLSNQKGRSIRYYKKYCSDPRFISVKSLIKTGDIVGADFCYRELPEQLDLYDYEAFDRCKTPFYATCSNIETGKAEYVRITDMKRDIDYIRASASLPYVSRIVEINGKKYLDGGCTDSIPIKAFRQMGYERNVVILTRNASYRKKTCNRFAPNLVYGKYPKFANAMLTRHTVYNQTTEYIEKLKNKKEVFVIRPKEPLNIGRLERSAENIQRVYDIGVNDGKACIKELLTWLEDNG